MPEQSRLHIAVIEAENYGMLVWGKDPCAAVKSYYDQMDAFCAPRDPHFHDEFTVTVFRIPEELEGSIQSMLGLEYPDEIEGVAQDLQQEHPHITSCRVRVVYTVQGAVVSELKRPPDLLGRGAQ
ncbi:hypothetical protein [Azospirillum tabaci]|uniref:hypothetical protein n=1 Tax=Azospirillum tabaci TaxID=2752310 RepID=UPI001660F947|nr:hypothetical protein [Azospirillum tabaci]